MAILLISSRVSTWNASAVPACPWLPMPSAVISQVRGLYVVGMAAEFDGALGELGAVRFNEIWDGKGDDLPTVACVELLACEWRLLCSSTGSDFSRNHFGSSCMVQCDLSSS